MIIVRTLFAMILAVSLAALPAPKAVKRAREIALLPYVSDARAYAELSETVDLDGKPMRTPEVLVFELNGDGRVARVDIFIQTPRE